MEVGAFVAGQDASDASDASAAAPATAEVLVAGADGETVAGEVLYSDVGLSFWGGVCPESGTVIDARHPLAGQCITGKILCLPSGRGSCTGSQVVLELVLNGDSTAKSADALNFTIFGQPGAALIVSAVQPLGAPVALAPVRSTRAVRVFNAVASVLSLFF